MTGCEGVDVAFVHAAVTAIVKHQVIELQHCPEAVSLLYLLLNSSNATYIHSAIVIGVSLLDRHKEVLCPFPSVEGD